MISTPPDPWARLTALATVAAALLVAFQIFRESWREYLRRRTARARITAISYKLRRQLRSWVGDPEDSNDLEGWIRNRQNDGSFGRHLDRAEDHLDQLMALRPDANGKMANGLDAAFILFLEGSRRLNEYASTPRPGSEGHIDWFQLRLDAEKDLRDCIAQLESHVILKSVLKAESRLAERREKGSVLEQAWSDAQEQHEERPPST